MSTNSYGRPLGCCVATSGLGDTGSTTVCCTMSEGTEAEGAHESSDYLSGSKRNTA